MEKPLLILDFDGVLCDSLPECFVSSWLAYYRLYLGQEPAAVSLEYRRRFDQLRPFIRNGEDYLVIHDALATNKPLKNQCDFDARIADCGTAALQGFRELMYRVRRELVASQRDFWLGLHHMFDWILPPLQQAAAHPAVYILSTKRREYIIELLADIPIDSARVLSSGGCAKGEIISELLLSHGSSAAIFIDDQIDHLRVLQDGRITPYLASWGYIQADWLSCGEFEVLNPPGAVDILRDYSSPL